MVEELLARQSAPTPPARYRAMGVDADPLLGSAAPYKNCSSILGP
jgi:hypothetical protein